MSLKMQCNKGFTLLEVLFSLAIFTIVIAGIPNFFNTQAQLNERSEIRTEAIAAAKIQLDALRLEDPASLPSSGSDDPIEIEIDNKTFDVITHYCENASFCDTNRNRHIRIEVEYKDEVRYEVETVFTQLR